MTEKAIITEDGVEHLIALSEEEWIQWEKEHSNSFIYQVQRGRLGHNVGLDNGLKRINNYLYGTHKARYYLIGADSGVGKTTIADFMYILNAWHSAKKLGRRIKIFYCSFEISKLDKMARWCSYFIFQRYGIELTTDYILGRINGKYLTPEHFAMVQEGYRLVQEIMKDVIMLEDAAHPTAIFEGIITTHYEKVGKVQRTTVTAEERKKGKKGFITGYTADDSDDITLLAVDHMALIGTEMGLNLKGSMDKLSRYFVILRNMFGTTIIAIQQFSTDLLAAKREKAISASGSKLSMMLSPQRLDFGDSKTTYRDADVVIGYVKPSEFELSDFEGYNLAPTREGGLGGFFIIQYLMKNRYGPAAKRLPLFLNPIAGTCYDLPQKYEEMLPWYEKAEQLDKLCLEYSPNND